MKRILFSKTTLGIMGGGAVVASGFMFTRSVILDETRHNYFPNSWDKYLLRAEAFTNSVLDAKFQKETLPWDQNWDKRDPKCLAKPLKANATDEEKEQYEEKLILRTPRSKRIIVLVRHGQYNDKGKDDSERCLTNLGREQADLTGKRLADVYNHYQKKMPYDENFVQQKLDINFVMSTMTRAVETADIVLKHFPNKQAARCDLIREGAPCEPVPEISSNLWNPTAQAFYEDGARIEAGFRKYIHRAEPSQLNDSFDIIICHANVIRYFVCRSLQLPPEAWLRFSLHNGSFTVISVQPNGRVSVSILGEAGHFPVEKMTFN